MYTSCVSVQGKVLLSNTPGYYKGPSRGGHDSAGAHLRSHQVSQESAKRSPSTIDHSESRNGGCVPALRLEELQQQAVHEELVGKQATGLGDC